MNCICCLCLVPSNSIPMSDQANKEIEITLKKLITDLLKCQGDYENHQKNQKQEVIIKQTANVKKTKNVDSIFKKTIQKLNKFESIKIIIDSRIKNVIDTYNKDELETLRKSLKLITVTKCGYPEALEDSTLIELFQKSMKPRFEYLAKCHIIDNLKSGSLLDILRDTPFNLEEGTITFLYNEKSIILSQLKSFMKKDYSIENILCMEKIVFYLYKYNAMIKAPGKDKIKLNKELLQIVDDIIKQHLLKESDYQVNTKEETIALILRQRDELFQNAEDLFQNQLLEQSKDKEKIDQTLIREKTNQILKKNHEKELILFHALTSDLCTTIAEDVLPRFGKEQREEIKKELLTSHAFEPSLKHTARKHTVIGELTDRMRKNSLDPNIEERK